MRTRFLLCLLSAAPALAATACFVPVPDGPSRGYETDEETCTNGYDDDGDGRADCRDEDCVVRGFCSLGFPIAPTGEAEGISPGFDRRSPEFAAERARALRSCQDRIDNDEDGRVDCADSGCSEILELCCVSEFNDAACSNGIDDDGNGFADCADFSCRNNPIVTVCSFEANCTNRFDDDGDRSIDCDDSDCAADPACRSGGEVNCGDGIDDDGDLRVDCADLDCQQPIVSPLCVGIENTVAFCTDGLDNDDDGRADCDDPNCVAAGLMPIDLYCLNAGPGPENTVARCSDGVDNDGNSFVDCRDFGCSRSTDPAVRALCPAENTVETCGNGIDDDGDGFTDCADFSCSREPDATPEAIMFCAERTESTLERCSDGMDNDGNGFTDCADFSCSRSTDPAILEFCTMRAEDTLERCSNGIDDDGNGFIDCADFSCSRSTDSGVQAICRLQGEAGFGRCSNGLDDDGNGFADCADNACSDFVQVDFSRFRCASDADCDVFFDGRGPGRCVGGQLTFRFRSDATPPPGPGEMPPAAEPFSMCVRALAPCRESAAPLAFTTIDEGPAPTTPTFDAARHSTSVVMDPPDLAAFATGACSDGIDNDLDGVVDCADFDCQWDTNVPRDLCSPAGARRLCE